MKHILDLEREHLFEECESRNEELRNVPHLSCVFDSQTEVGKWIDDV